MEPCPGLLAPLNDALADLPVGGDAVEVNTALGFRTLDQDDGPYVLDKRIKPAVRPRQIGHPKLLSVSAKMWTALRSTYDTEASGGVRHFRSLTCHPWHRTHSAGQRRPGAFLFPPGISRSSLIAL